MGRAFGGPSHKGESYYFLAYNRGKKSLVLDLRTGLGKKAFYDLVKVSDVVIDNFRPGVLERLQIDYATAVLPGAGFDFTGNTGTDTLDLSKANAKSPAVSGTPSCQRAFSRSR